MSVVMSKSQEGGGGNISAHQEIPRQGGGGKQKYEKTRHSTQYGGNKSNPHTSFTIFLTPGAGRSFQLFHIEDHILWNV